MPDDEQNDDESTEVAPADDPSDVEEVDTETRGESGEADDAAGAEANTSVEAEESEIDGGVESAAAESEDESTVEQAAESAGAERSGFGEGGETDEPPEKAADEVYCSSCGTAIKKDAEVCPECGVRQMGGIDEKSPGIAAIASFFIPGLGDLYNGEFGRGGIVFLVWFVGACVWGLLVTVLGLITFGVGLALLPLYAVTNVISAYLSYKRAEKINAGEIVV